MANLNFDAAVFANAITGFGKTVSRTPVTKTTSNMDGDETLTDGTPENIEVAFFTRTDKYAQDNPGLILDADAIVITLPTQTISKNDKIAYDGVTYRIIDDIFTRRLGATAMYKTARLKVI